MLKKMRARCVAVPACSSVIVPRAPLRPGFRVLRPACESRVDPLARSSAALRRAHVVDVPASLAIQQQRRVLRYRVQRAVVVHLRSLPYPLRSSLSEYLPLRGRAQSRRLTGGKGATQESKALPELHGARRVPPNAEWFLQPTSPRSE